MKYILKLLPLVLGFNTPIFTNNKRITALKPYLVNQALQQRAQNRAEQKNVVQREIENKTIARAPHAIKKQKMPARPAQRVHTQPTHIKITPVQQTQELQAPASENLHDVLTHLEAYVDSVFSCIQRFLSYEDNGKLHHFAHEIETYVHKLDHNVVKPLRSMTDPLARDLLKLAEALRHNQSEFRKKLMGGYKNAMSLGFALVGLKKEAIKGVNGELGKCAPSIKCSPLASRFEPIEKKIIDLTNYTVSEIQALKVLHKRF
jgi:hypothetical protein